MDVQGPLPPAEMLSFDEWLGVDLLTLPEDDPALVDDEDAKAMRAAWMQQGREVGAMAQNSFLPAEETTEASLMYNFLMQNAVLLYGVDQKEWPSYVTSTLIMTKREDFTLARIQEAFQQADSSLKAEGNPVMDAIQSARFILSKPPDRRQAYYQLEMFMGIEFRHYEARIDKETDFYQKMVNHVRAVFVGVNIAPPGLFSEEVKLCIATLAQAMYNMDEKCRVDEERPVNAEMDPAERQRVIKKLDEARYNCQHYLAQCICALRDHRMLVMMAVEFARIIARWSNYQSPPRNAKNAAKLENDFRKDTDLFEEFMEEMIEYLETRSGDGAGAAAGDKKRRAKGIDELAREELPTASTAKDETLRQALITFDKLKTNCITMEEEYAPFVANALKGGRIQSLLLATDEIILGDDSDTEQTFYEVSLAWNCNSCPDLATSWNVAKFLGNEKEAIPDVNANWENLTAFMTKLLLKSYRVARQTAKLDSK